MGKKAERIEDLEAELADTKAELVAAKFLLRSIGDTLEVTLDDNLTMDTAPRLLRQFLDRMREKPRPPARTKRRAAGSWDTFDDVVDEQIDRLDAQGLTKPREAGALVQTEPGNPSPYDLGVLVVAVADELGLEVATLPHNEALVAIHQEIIRIKNMGADTEAESSSKFLAKGDSLGQAIANSHAQNADLRDGATQARTIVARLAAVMQVASWDKDGTELLERAQQYENWKHRLKQRVRELRAVNPSDFAGSTNMHIAEELQSHLAALMSRKEMVDFAKALPRSAAAPVVVHEPYPFTFRDQDAQMIENALVRGDSSTRSSELENVFKDISESRVGRGEFARVMNVVVLPILARQKAAQRVPPEPT
jgi:hypothetical protein